MSKKEIAWILVRCAGLWLLIQGLTMLPALFASLPAICQLIASWEMLADASWIELLSRGIVANFFNTIIKTAVYLIAASWFLVRGDRLIRLIAEYRN